MKTEQKDFAPEMEGQRSILREQKKSFDSGERKNRIDLKKMIVYSEILKPKFD
ncbi:MAG: hypothetical protein MJY61_02320 [Bacteroidales bacterium]|nr:hypothetical protein [Bacteroidales bacterium]